MQKQDVLDFFGDQYKAADFIGISRQAVEAWKDKIPERKAARLHQMTQGQLKYDFEDYT